MRIIRVWFEKKGDAAYISHLDLQRVMHRALAKAQLPAWYSLGFNPHIYLTFPLPLPLGQESCCEAVDFKTEDDALAFDTVQSKLNAVLPAGIRVLRVTAPVLEAKDITAARYDIRLPALQGKTARALEKYNSTDHAFVTKMGKQNGRKTQKQSDLKDSVSCLTWQQEGETLLLQLQLPAGSTVNVNPGLLISYLQTENGIALGSADICRTAILAVGDREFA